MYYYIFKSSPPISTYIYALDAGCYALIDNDKKDFKIPMRVGIRKSKIEYLDARNLFRNIESSI